MFAARYLLSSLTVSLFLTACTDADEIAGTRAARQKYSAPQVEIAASVGGRTERGIEDEILKIEARVPGLGGVFSENGRIVVYAPISSSRADVLHGLALASPWLNVDALSRKKLSTGDDIEIRPSRYAFSQLVSWVENGGSLFSIEGVSWIDADEQLNKVTISITEEKYRSAVVRLAESLGIKDDALNILVGPRERATTGLTGSWSPTGSGIQIANVNGQICSIGWNVHRGGSDPETSEEGFFTAGHCAPTQPGAGTTGAIYQPYSSRIGFITQNPAWNVSDTACTNAGVSYCGRVDAMYVKYDDPSISLNRVPYTGTNPGTNNTPSGTSVAGWWTIISSSFYNPWVNDSVDKVGRTTGWTRGTLANTCAPTKVTADSPYSDYMILCADKVQNASAGQGDSGGPVFVPQNPPNPVYPVGVEFSAAGSFTGTPGQQYCYASCIYSYSRMSRILLFLPEPPY